jgi:NADH-quinone oxidoreductase subunit N
VTVNLSVSDLLAVGPEIVLSLFGLALILLDAFARPLRPSFPYVALAGIFIANWMSRYVSGTYFSRAIEANDLTRFIDLAALTAATLAILGGAALLERDKKNQGEFYALLLWTTAGLTLMVKGGDLLVIFIGLELMSFGLYVLAAWYREAAESVEAAMKYFLVGALASAFLLFGVATIYGRVGTTNLNAIREAALGRGLLLDPLLSAGLLAVVAALCFKIALVPFHSWAPDVYQGMTTPAVTFLSTAPKAGAFVVLVRILVALSPSGLGEPWQPLFGIIAIASILFGNIVALSQRDVKRMLAYSGIAQMGYGAIALATFNAGAFEGLLVFLAGYILTNAAAFISSAALSAGEKEPHTLADLAGMGRRRPFAATILSLSMVSLAGFPPTVGFIGKFLIFRSALAAGLMPLALVGIFGSLVSVGFYFRVIYYLWMREPGREVEGAPEDSLSWASFSLVAAGILLLGILPGPLLDMARAAAAAVPFSPFR